MTAQLIKGNETRHLIRMSIPMFFGMLFVVALNITDTYFIAKIGDAEFEAISFTLPVIGSLFSVAFGLSTGVLITVSKAIGEGNHSKVKRLTTNSLLLSLIIAFIFIVVGLLTIEPLFKTLGASESFIDLISKYMVIWYSGILLLIVPLVGNSAIRATGNTKIPAMIMGLSVVANITLDPILIFGWGPIPALGLEGAAYATLIARFVALVLGLHYLSRKLKMISWSKNVFADFLSDIKSILKISIPAIAANLVLPLSAGIITRLVSEYGPEAVAAYNVGSQRIDFIVFMVLIALSSALAPFVGQNLGANHFDRIKTAINKCLRFSIMWGLVTGFIMYFFKSEIGQVFDVKDKTLEYFELYFTIIPISYAFGALTFLSSNLLNVFGRPVLSGIITFTQFFVIYIPLAFLLSEFIGLKGVFISFVIAEIISGIVSYLIQDRVRKQLEYKAEQDQKEAEETAVA